MARRLRPFLIVSALIAVVSGCGDGAPEPAEPSAAPREIEHHETTDPIAGSGAAGVVPASAESSTPDAGVSPAVDSETRQLLEHLTNARVVRARPISKRSLSLRLFLRDGRDAAFKPLLREKPTARYEVAAFRVCRLLGLDLVQPVAMRRIHVDNFEWMLGAEHAEIGEALREQAALDERSGVWGAAIAWVDGLEPSGLEGSAGERRLKSLLALDGPPFDREPLAVDASAMVVFDYLTGNWDRFSGGNLFRRDGRLVLLDNNGAFASWSETKQTRMDELLGLVFRFSKRLIRSLKSLSATRVERALAQEPWHRTRRLLTRREVDSLLARRDAISARVDSLIAVHGEDRVLVFP